MTADDLGLAAAVNGGAGYQIDPKNAVELTTSVVRYVSTFGGDSSTTTIADVFPLNAKWFMGYADAMDVIVVVRFGELTDPGAQVSISAGISYRL